MKAKEMAPKTAIVIAGGEGTRLRPLTYTKPKPLIPVLGKPILEYTLDELARNGIRKVVFALGYKAEMVEQYFNGKEDLPRIKLSYSVEREKLGTGGAIKLALGQIPEDRDIIVINGDNLFRVDFADMYSRHKKNGAVVTLAVATETDKNVLSTKGVVTLDGERIKRFVEKPAPDSVPSNMFNAGISIINRSIASAFPEKDAFSFERDVLEKLVEKGLVYAYPVSVFYTIDNHEQYRKVEEALKQHKI